MLPRQSRLLRLILLRHLPGVAALRLGSLELLVLHRNEFCAEGGDLLLSGGTHIGGCHHCPKPSRGRDRLQTGDARAHDKDARGRDRAGRRHHHGHGAAEVRRRLDDCLIAREVGLAREHVHHLRARDARDELERERLQPRFGDTPQLGFIAEGIHERHNRGAACSRKAFRPRYLQHQVGVLQRGFSRAGDLCAGLAVTLV